MLGQAAIEEGLIAEGLELTINQLEPGNIVYLTQNGEGHFSVITSITSTTVYLADSNLGNINMTLTEFTSYYSGFALVVTNDNGDSQLSMGRNLSISEMGDLVGSDWWWRWNAADDFVGVVTGPTHQIGRLIYTQSVAFNSFYGSTVLVQVTVNDWSNIDAYLVKIAINIYDNIDWAGAPIRSETQGILLDPSQNTYTFSFSSPALQHRSYHFDTVTYTIDYYDRVWNDGG